MSYGQGRTMIDELPDLEELERGGMQQMQPMQPMHGNMPPHGAGLPPGSADKYQKYIRGSHRAVPGSGMGSMNMGQHSTHMMGPGSQGHMDTGGYAVMEPYEEQMQQQAPPPGPPPPMPPVINCIEIANHIQGCPICSRFYNNDKTVYIIAIVVLTIVCLLLLKRVLNV
jgi:hypothetical protein